MAKSTRNILAAQETIFCEKAENALKDVVESNQSRMDNPREQQITLSKESNARKLI